MRVPIIEDSANKSNSEWDTKSVSWERTIFDIDSKSGGHDITRVKNEDIDQTNDYDTVQSLWNNIRSASTENRPRQFTPNSGSKFIKTDPIIEKNSSKLKPNPHLDNIKIKQQANNLQESDFLNIVHMQASHLENLVLYIEDMNSELENQK